MPRNCRSELTQAAPSAAFRESGPWQTHGARIRSGSIRLGDVVRMVEKEDRDLLVRLVANIDRPMRVVRRLVPIDLPRLDPYLVIRTTVAEFDL